MEASESMKVIVLALERTNSNYSSKSTYGVYFLDQFRSTIYFQITPCDPNTMGNIKLWSLNV